MILSPLRLKSLQRVSSVALRAPAPYKQGALLYLIFSHKVFNTNRHLEKEF